MGVNERTVILTVEAGHSTVHSVLFRGTEVIKAQNLSLEKGLLPGNLETEVVSLIGENYVRAVTGTTVNNKISDDLRDFCTSIRSHDFFWFEKSSEIPIKSNYSNPDQLGTDRALAALAAWDFFKDACTVLDIGSAVTVDAVDSEGAFMGGTIFPGPGMALSCFQESTGLKIPREIAKPDDFPPLNTQDALNGGLFWGYIGALSELTGKIMSIVGGENIMVTGGWSELFLPHLSYHAVRDHHLVAKGLYLCALSLIST